MVLVKLKGGLGNQMFQYAIGRHLSLKNDSSLRFDISELGQHSIHDTKRNYELHVFNIYGKIAPKLLLLRVNKLNKSKIFKILNLSYKPIFQKDMYFDASVLNEKGNIILDGYWQSEEYFNDIRDVLIKDFALTIAPDNINKDMLKRINNSNSVCIHVRRGDYISDNIINAVHGTCSVKYYLSAVNVIEGKVAYPEFFIFSDDPNWCKSNLKLNYPTHYVDINDVSKGYEDLRLMYNCNHFICANSSFSWWGAWLSDNSNKIICAPRKWFVGKDEGDIVPKDWIRVDG